MKHGSISPAMQYIRELYAPEDAILHDIRKTFEQRGMAIQIGAEEGKILHVLLKLHGAKTVIEIGTLGGYSAIWMARALPENGHVHTIEGDPQHVVLAREFITKAGLQDKITVWEGRALDVLPHVAEIVKNIDAMFIDADKINYPHYLDWAEAHLRRGGLVFADNTLLFDTVYLDTYPQDGRESKTAWEGMRMFNLRLADPKRFTGVMLPTAEGLSVAIMR